MLEIILLIVGIQKAVRLPRFRRLSADTFPNVEPAKFDAWHKAHLKAMNIYLLATWGVLFVKLAARGMRFSFEEAGALNVVVLVTWGSGLIAAYVLGRKANDLQVDADIDWPKQPEPVRGQGSRACPECGMRFETSDYSEDAAEWRCTDCNVLLDRASEVDLHKTK